MKWVKVKERPPENYQEVLLRTNGIFYLAIYCRDQNRFLLKNGNAVNCDDNLQWTSLVGATA